MPMKPAPISFLWEHTRRSGGGGFYSAAWPKRCWRAAPCSVEVLRTPAVAGDTSRPLKVLLATDGSDCSLLAARSIASRPWPARTEVRVLSVVEPEVSLLYVPFPPGAAETLRAQAMQRTQKAIREAEEIVTNAGLHASETISVLLDEPESIIAAASGEWKADLIVLGSHGRRGFNRLLLGSVSEGVALHAGCSVEVVRSMLARSQVPSRLSAEKRARMPALAHN